MATVDELKNGKEIAFYFRPLWCLLSIIWRYKSVKFSFLLVLKETLENRGVLGQIRARVRAEVFAALDDQVR